MISSLRNLFDHIEHCQLVLEVGIGRCETDVMMSESVDGFSEVMVVKNVPAEMMLLSSDFFPLLMENIGVFEVGLAMVEIGDCGGGDDDVDGGLYQQD